MMTQKLSKRAPEEREIRACLRKLKKREAIPAHSSVLVVGSVNLAERGLLLV